MLPDNRGLRTRPMLALVLSAPLAKLCSRPGEPMGVPCDGCEAWCNPDTVNMDECAQCDCVHRLVALQRLPWA